MRTREAIAEARRMGRDAGLAAASWVFDGNTDDPEYRATLQGILDGDPAILDRLNPPNLSGEWANSETPQTLAESLGLEGRPDVMDDVCSAWEDAANAAYMSEVERVCRARLTA